MQTLRLFVALTTLALAACSPPPASNNPAWVDEQIRTFQDQPLGNPPQSIWRYDYNGQVVYYLPAQCCDMYSSLFDASGNLLCAPDGGLDGKGDGQCPDFGAQRSNEVLIWQDPRTPSP